MTRINIIQIISFFIYLLYHVLILKNIVLFKPIGSITRLRRNSR